MKRTPRNFWLGVLAVALTVNLLVGYQVYSREAEASGENEAYGKVSVMMHVLYLIRQDYVDGKKVGYENLLYNAMRGMVSSLDPFSEFMTPDEHRGMLELTEGRFGGLGITITVRKGVLTVVAPVDDSPASRAGILPGDQIVRIGDALTTEMDMKAVLEKLKGEPGTKVAFTVYRPATQQTLPFTLERAIIEIPSVTDVKVLAGGIGYLRITEFSEKTAEKMKDALETLQAKQIRALVLDLRNNPGGLLVSAVDVCSYFLPSKRLVVSTEGRRPSQKQEFLTDNRPKLPADMPMAILVNQGSASAAEIVSACLQDWGRAVLVGEKTFGKGSVQSLIDLADGSALRLTTAMYYTPSRRLIHEHGIEPDIVVPLTEKELKRLLEIEPGAENHGPDPTIDRQLQRAMETLKTYESWTAARGARFGKLRPAEEPKTALAPTDAAPAK